MRKQRKLDVNKLNHGERGLSQCWFHAIREIRLAGVAIGKKWPRRSSSCFCAKQLVFYLWNIYSFWLFPLWNIIIRYWVLFAAWRAPTGTRMRACLFVMRPNAGVFVFVCEQPHHSLARPLFPVTNIINFGRAERNPVTESLFFSVMRPK